MKPGEVIQLFYAEIAEGDPIGDAMHYGQDGPVNDFLCFFLLVIHEDIEDKGFIRRYASIVRNIIKADQKVSLPEVRLNEDGEVLFETYADKIEYDMQKEVECFRRRWESIHLYLHEGITSEIEKGDSQYFHNDLVESHHIKNMLQLARFHHNKIAYSALMGFMTIFNTFISIFFEDKAQEEKVFSKEKSLRVIALAQIYKSEAGEGQQITRDNCIEVAQSYGINTTSDKLYQYWNEYLRKEDRIDSKGSKRRNTNHLENLKKAKTLLNPDSKAHTLITKHIQEFKLYEL